MSIPPSGDGMQHDPADAPRGIGALVLTEVDRIDLGEHAGHRLHARVQRRSARFSAGRRWHLSIALGRIRPVAIEVATAEARYDLPVPRPREPWLDVVWASVALWCAGEVAGWMARRMRGGGSQS